MHTDVFYSLFQTSLHVFVYLLGVVVLCDSFCFFKLLEIKDLNNPPKGCTDRDGKLYDFGSEWTRDCVQCSCTKDGMSCCSILPDADTMYIPEDCELMVDKEACSAKVVLKSDHTKVCDPIQ
ncbi:beta-microseminoprotein [Scomber japonicus]|uniref:beta-microseminoprotein n=1 Tax=Scomber japonicus TaxID=13676 RepID=UPI0023056A93|nr:beta-microseminoprotein [Scomber japonicus]